MALGVVGGVGGRLLAGGIAAWNVETLILEALQ